MTRWPIIRVEAQGDHDTAVAEALLIAAEAELRGIDVYQQRPVVDGLVLLALDQVRVAREGLELRRRWPSTPEGGERG